MEKASEQQWAEMRRRVKRLGYITRRVEREGSGGRNWSATTRAASVGFSVALRALVAIEDAEGVEAVAEWSDKLTGIRQRAMACGLLSAADVSWAEREAIA